MTRNIPRHEWHPFWLWCDRGMGVVVGILVGISLAGWYALCNGWRP